METTPEGWNMTASSLTKSLEDFTGKFSQRIVEQTFDERVKELPLNILEVCAGSGFLSVSLAQAHPNSHVIATDFAPKLVEITRERAKLVKNIEVKVADGQNLEFPNESFDYVINNFGVFFFPDINKGFAEMYRVLKSGGSAGFSTWSEKIFPAELIKEIFGRFGIVPPANAAPPLISRTNNPEKITKLLNDAGFVNFKITPHEDYYALEEYSELLAFFLNNPAMMSMLSSFSDDQKKEFENVTLNVLRDKFPSLPVKLCSTAFIVTATKK